MFSLFRKAIVPLGWLLLVHVLLLFPKSGMPDEEIDLIPHFDKIVHFSIYFGVLFTSTVWIFLNGKNSPREQIKWGSFLLLLAIVDGTVVEFLQRTEWVNRDFDWYDVLFDCIGAIVGLAVALLIYNRFWARKSPCGNRGRNQN